MNERAPGFMRRANDRTFATGVLLSVGVHALFVVAIAAAVMRAGPVARQRSDLSGESFQVALLPTADAVKAGGAAPPGKSSSPAAPRPDRPASANSSDLSSVPAGPPAPPTPRDQPARTGDSGVMAATTAPPAPAPPDPGVEDAYRRRLFEHIAAYRTVPPAAPSPAFGVVMVRFRLTRSGDVLAASVASSSGAPELDQAAVDTIWRARPMPSIPPALPERLTVVLPVAFGPAGGRAPG